MASESLKSLPILDHGTAIAFYCHVDAAVWKRSAKPAAAPLSITENFDTLSAPLPSSFSGFGGQATFYSYGPGGLLIDPTSLPPRSPNTAIFGYKASIVIQFNQAWQRLSAYFRVPNFDMRAKLARLGSPTFAVVEFYRNGSQVEQSVYVTVNQSSYTHFDWDLNAFGWGTYDAVVISSNSGDGDQIGIDDMTAS